MKTKKQILEGIKRARGIRDDFSGADLKAFRDIFNGQIRALQWALGYKVGEWYWCNGCHIQHKNLKCPRCGGKTIKPLSKKLNVET